MLTQSLSTRSSLSFTYGLERTDVTIGNFNLPISGSAASLPITRRDLVLHVGYTLREGNYIGTGSAIRGNDLDLGVDYRRALSFSRRTTVSFTTGSALLDRNDGATGTANAATGHYLHLLGWRISITKSAGPGARSCRTIATGSSLKVLPSRFSPTR